MRMRLCAGVAATAGLLALIAPAAAMPGAGLKGAKAPAASPLQQVEFKRRPDGSMYYVRPRFDDKGPYFFTYQGYAYPYNPGYTYRLTRGELRPSDRLRRYRIVD